MAAILNKYKRRDVWFKTAAILLIGSGLLIFPYGASADPQDHACNLPRDLQREITGKYPGRTLVSLSDLGDEDKQHFLRERGNACPGLVKVDFYGDGLPTLALALTTKSDVHGKTELVVAHQVSATWKTTTLEIADGPAAVLWSEKPGDYEDVYAEKKIHARSPVIVFVAMMHGRSSTLGRTTE